MGGNLQLLCPPLAKISHFFFPPDLLCHRSALPPQNRSLKLRSALVSEWDPGGLCGELQGGCLPHEPFWLLPTLLVLPFPAVINALSQRYFLQASDQKDLQDWVEALNRASKITVGYSTLFSIVPSTIPRDPYGWALLVYLPSPSQPSCGEQQLCSRKVLLELSTSPPAPVPPPPPPPPVAPAGWDLAQPAPHCGCQRVALLCLNNLFIQFPFFLECRLL